MINCFELSKNKKRILKKEKKKVKIKKFHIQSLKVFSNFIRLMNPNYTQFQDEKNHISPRFRSNKVELPNISPQPKEPPSSQATYNSYNQPTYHQQAPPPLSQPFNDEAIKRGHKQSNLENASHAQHELDYSGIQIPADWNEAEDHAVNKKNKHL